MKMSKRDFSVAVDWSYFAWYGMREIVRASRSSAGRMVIAEKYAFDAKRRHRAGVGEATYMVKSDESEKAVAASLAPAPVTGAARASQEATSGFRPGPACQRKLSSDEIWIYRPALHAIGTVKTNPRKRKWDEYLVDAVEKRIQRHRKSVIAVREPKSGPPRKKQIHNTVSEFMVDRAKKVRATRTSRGHGKTKTTSSFFFAADGAGIRFAHMVESVPCPPRCPYPVVHEPSPLREYWSADEL